jgi:hypothetical protein
MNPRVIFSRFEAWLDVTVRAEKPLKPWLLAQRWNWLDRNVIEFLQELEESDLIEPTGIAYPRKATDGMSEIVAQIYKRQQIPFDLRKEVYERDGYTCQEPSCGMRTHLSVDHVIAVTSGGATVLENLTTLCLSCNAKKGARNGGAL